MRHLFILAYLGFITGHCFAQSYEQEITNAGKAYEKHQFDSCAFYFKHAFILQQGSGGNLYYAAVCNTLNGNQREAFALLRSAISNGANVSKLRIDPELEMLHHYKKWKSLLKYAAKRQYESFKKTQFPKYAALLAELWEKDQYYRFRLGAAIRLGDTVETNRLWQKMKVADSVNATVSALLTIIDKIGWPTSTKVGKEGAGTAFLIIDHSSKEIMEKYLPSLEEAALKGEATMSSFATLKDRVLVNQGKKQIYGTQKYWDESEKKFVYFPIEDEKNVNKQRREAGLEELVEFR